MPVATSPTGLGIATSATAGSFRQDAIWPSFPNVRRWVNRIAELGHPSQGSALGSEDVLDLNSTCPFKLLGHKLRTLLPGYRVPADPIGDADPLLP
eukprot:4414928-Prorocentrum_lima.AAC.1